MMPKAPRSVTIRLTLLFAAVSTTVLLILGLLIAALVDRHFEEMDVDLLAGKLELVSHTLADIRQSEQLPLLPERLDSALVGHHGLALVIHDEDGRPLYSTPYADFPEALMAPPRAGEASPLRWQDGHGNAFRGIHGSAVLGLPGQPAVVIAAATDLGHHEHFMAAFRRALWTVVALAAVISGLLGWAVARQGLAPLRAICREAAAITADRLDRRLASDAIPDELAEVAHTLNDMLARLEESFRRLADFSSDLAHELRTPLSNLLTQTQVSLSRRRSPAEYEEVLASNAEEIERLAKMISDMLFLAKAEHALVIPERQRVDLRQAAAGLCDFYETLAADRGVTLRLNGQATVSGDPLMLRRAMANLLSNAFQHTPAGGEITLDLLQDDDGAAIVRVENSGDGIAPEHLPRLFDRFYRADPARQRLSDGAGLGLAITRSILRAHGGDARARSANGRNAFELVFPAPAPQD